MGGEALRLGDSPYLLDQACLADARLAAHVDDLAASPTEARTYDVSELLELCLSANERAAACRYGVVGNAAQAPDASGHIDALELHLAKPIAHAATRKRSVNAVGKESFSGTSSRYEPGCQIYRIAQNRIILRIGAADGAGHDFAAGNADMR